MRAVPQESKANASLVAKRPPEPVQDRRDQGSRQARARAKARSCRAVFRSSRSSLAVALRSYHYRGGASTNFALLVNNGYVSDFHEFCRADKLALYVSRKFLGLTSAGLATFCAKAVRKFGLPCDLDELSV